MFSKFQKRSHVPNNFPVCSTDEVTVTTFSVPSFLQARFLNIKGEAKVNFKVASYSPLHLGSQFYGLDIPN